MRYNRAAWQRGLSHCEHGNGWNAESSGRKNSEHDDIFDDLGPAYSNGDNSITAALPFQFNNCPTCVPLTDISIHNDTMLLQAPKIGFILGATSPALLKGITFTITSSP
jgi:hypothetical protein